MQGRVMRLVMKRYKEVAMVSQQEYSPYKKAGRIYAYD